MLHFPVNSVEFFRGPFFAEHFRWLLLHDHVRITLMVYESNISMVYKYSIFLKKFLFSSLCTEVTLKIIFCVENELWCSEITKCNCKMQCLIGNRFTRPNSSSNLFWLWIKINYKICQRVLLFPFCIYIMNPKGSSTIFSGSDNVWSAKKHCQSLRYSFIYICIYCCLKSKALLRYYATLCIPFSGSHSF